MSLATDQARRRRATYRRASYAGPQKTSRIYESKHLAAISNVIRVGARANLFPHHNAGCQQLAAAVLGPIKPSPSSGREDAASLDRPCARRL
jgi:hypothetical protein